MSYIYITISRGPRERDFLTLGILDHLLAQIDQTVIIITPAYQEARFFAKCSREGVIVEAMKGFSLPWLHSLSIRARQRLARNEHWDNLWLGLEERVFGTNLYSDLFEKYPPSLVVSTDPVWPSELSLAIEARKRKIPVVGLVRSWDHLFKRQIYTRFDWLGVWSPVNRQEAIELEHYAPDRIVMTGAPQFDLYFDETALSSREEFFGKLGFDPDRKLILLATGGPRFKYIQPAWLNLLLVAADSDQFVQPVEIMCRTHPADFIGPFLPYIKEGRVRFDLYERWSPTLEWVVTREDIIHQANTLKHADVVITPASTITLEAAIFDTPTCIIAFSDVNPQVTAETLNARTFQRHFRTLLERDLVPVAYSAEELVSYVNRFIASPESYRQERREIVRDWVYYTDGQSAQRVAEFIAQCLDEGKGR